MVRRPVVSLKDDHQRGKMEMLSMYSATERLVTVAEALRSRLVSARAAVDVESAIKHVKIVILRDIRRIMALPSEVAAAAKATTNVMNHFTPLG